MTVKAGAPRDRSDTMKLAEALVERKVVPTTISELNERHKGACNGNHT